MKFVLLVLLLCGAALAKPHKKTQPDDPNVLNPDNETDDDQTAEFNTEMTEGDIMPNGKNGEDRNAVSDPNRLWPNGIVPYTIDSRVTSTMRKQIQAAMDDYHSLTCIKFVPRTNEQAYVRINSDKQGCYAWLGRSGGEQPLNLQNNGCEHKGTIIHEMLHTIGFAHEQSRSDRDQYITVNFENIQDGMESQFKKLNPADENTQGMGYDYSSVMHYPDWGFSKNGQPVITTKDPTKQSVIGQRKGFSTQDVKEVNGLYKCNGKTSGLTGATTSAPSGGSSGSCTDKYPTSCQQMVASYGQSVCQHSVTVNGSPAGTVADICNKSCQVC